jgi:hypothetical protein
MGIMNRNLKTYTMKRENFPEKIRLQFHDKEKVFYFGSCVYMDSDCDEAFVSYKAMPWDNKKLGD